MSRYVIRGGDEGYERLLLLARDRRPDTLALFARAGLHAGLRCIDLGCGGGEVTFDIAQLVDPGVVIGVDMDEVKLSRARQAAADRGTPNVEFRTGDVTAWDEPAAYDIVYCRFLLQHLNDPIGMLRRMWAGVRPGGTLIVEDADFDGWSWYPPSPAFEFFVRAYSHTLACRGGDHALGRKLHHHFAEADIPTPQIALVQSIHAGESKILAWSTLYASADAIVSERIATQAEVTEALAKLERYSRDPATLIVGPRVFQCFSHRS